MHEISGIIYWNDRDIAKYVTEKQPWHRTHFFDDREKRQIANRVLRLHEQDPNLYAGDKRFVKSTCVERLMMDAMKQNLEITAARQKPTRSDLEKKTDEVLVSIQNGEIDPDTYSPEHSSASSEKLDRSDLESSADAPYADEARYSDLDIYSRTPTPANARMPPKATSQVSISQAVRIAREASSLVNSQTAAVEKAPESLILTVERLKGFTPVNSPFVSHPSASAAAGTKGMAPKNTKAGQIFWGTYEIWASGDGSGDAITPMKKTQPANQYEYQSWKLYTELEESPIDASDPKTLPPVRVHLDNFNTRRIAEALHAGVLTKDFAHKNWPTTFASDESVQATSVPRGKDETDENGHVVKLFNTYLLVPGRDAMAR